jgi:uncharacterized membrane protein YbhN (UPF0104 family)
MSNEPHTNAPPQRAVLVRRVVVAAVFGALIFAGLALYGDVSELRATAEQFAPSAFALGLLLAALNYVIRIVRWQYYLGRIGVRIPWGPSALIFLSGFVMSVTPGKIGEVFKSLLLHDSYGTSVARSAPIVVAERLTDLIALVLLTALGSLAFVHGPSIALSGAVFVSGVLLVCAYRPLGEWLLRLSERMPVVGRLSPKLREAYDALIDMTRPGPLFVGTATAFIAWTMECGSLYAIVHGFEGASLSLEASTFAYAASTIAGAVAMMPGGLGVTELGMTWLLVTLGDETIRPAVASATTILVRIATLWFAVVIGLVALAAHRATTRKRG